MFDTTVLISAFLSRSGVAGELLDLTGRAFDLYLAPDIIAEARGVLLTRSRLRKGSGYSDEEVEEYCRASEELAQVVRDPPPLTGVVRDVEDDVIVAAAEAAQADYLVARDRDLLDLGSYEGIAVVTPEAFRGLLRARGHP